jgi:hypothetical protein
MSAASSGLKSKPKKKPARIRQQEWLEYCLLQAGSLHGLLFNLEDGGEKFFRNVS